MMTTCRAATRNRARARRPPSVWWTLAAVWALHTVPGAAQPLCGGGGTSALALPTLTYVRAYRAPFTAPTRMAVDAAGNVYVTDPDESQIIVRAPNGRLLTRAAVVAHPISVAADSNGHIYVGDGATGSVTAFDLKWQPLSQLGKGPGEFQQPNDLSVDTATGNIYVADSPAHVVKIYAANGSFLHSFGGQGNGLGQFNFPAALAVDAAARQVLVVDQLNYRVQVFDVAGAYVSCFGVQGSGPGQFNMPQAVMLDGHGRVYVADSVEGRVQVLDHNGDFVGYIGDFGESPGHLRLPMAMAIDPSNRLFISAANNARLEMFGLDSFADPETVTPALLHVEPNTIERANPPAVVVAYVEIPGYAPEQVAAGSVTANGVPAAATPYIVGDHDGNGVPDVGVTFDRGALLATLPADGSGTIAVTGTIGHLQFEASGTVQVTTCGPATVCSLGDADPQCNEAVCVAPGGCTIQPKVDGTGCEDGNACTVGDACRAGVCVGIPLSCDDHNVCTDDSCDPVAGCVHVDNTAPCDDQNACTVGDVCLNGVCSGTPVSCDDGNACTDDSCDAIAGCVHVNNAAPCDDGNACTVADTCNAGVCQGTPLSCDDGNACTDDRCDPASGCAHVANSAPCDDGNACTIGDLCSAGTCHGLPRSCDDNNVCTDDTCNPATGCVHTDNTVACDDHDPGTVRDTCDGAGKCAGQVTAGNYALLAWPLHRAGHRSATLSTQVLVRGNVCAENLAVGPAVQIDGDAVGWTAGGAAITFGPGTAVTGNVVTPRAAVAGIDQVAIGGQVDQSATAGQLTDCFAARYRATTRRAELAALATTPGLTLGAIALDDGTSRRIPAQGTLGAGQVVIDTGDVQLGASSTLTLAGSTSTYAVVVRVGGKMVIGRGAQIATEGLPPERLVFVIDGSATLYRRAVVAGSLFAGGRIQAGVGSTIAGALFGSAVDLAPYTRVELHPFIGW